MKELSIIIVAYGSNDLLKRCLASLPVKKRWETIVVDNNQINRGFSKGCNVGARQATSEYLMFLNPDCVVKENAIETLLQKLKNERTIGIIGPQLLDTSGTAYLSYTRQPTTQSAPVVYSFLDKIFPHNRWSRGYWYRGQRLDKERKVEGISGAAMMIRKVDFQALGGFDERFFMYWEDLDLCRRIRQRGKQVVYYPMAQIVHQKGGATDTESRQVREWFRRSRYRFFAKHFGKAYASLLELWLLAGEEWRLLTVMIVATWLRFDRITSLSPLIFDQARDYLAAWEGLRTGEIPLLGIPSSLPRFRQGPLYIWLLMVVFSIFGVKPEVAAVMAAFIGLAAVAGVYLLAEKEWGRTAATLAALLLATSPLAVAHSRMAFITNAIPLVSVIYLWFLTRPFSSWRSLFIVGFMAGLLLQFELALFPTIGLVAVYLWRERRKVERWAAAAAIATGGFLLGQLPQVIFDLSNRFSQLGLFVGWVGYRIIRLTGVIPGKSGSFGSIPIVLERINEYGTKMAGWDRSWFGWIWLSLWLMAIVFYLRRRRTNRLFQLLMWWLALLLMAFFVHGGPSEAYFPGLFVPIVLMIGWGASQIGGRWQIVMSALIVVLALSNAVFLQTHDHLLATTRTREGLSSNYGLPLVDQIKIAKYVVAEAQGKPITLMTLDPGNEFASFLDNWKYLVNVVGGRVTDDGWPVWISGGAGNVPTLPYSAKRMEIEGMVISTPYE